MRISFSVLCGTAMILLGCTSAVVYTIDNPQAHFTIEHPQGWFIDDDSPDAEGLYFVNFSPEAKNSSAALLVWFEDKTNITQEEFIQRVQNDFEHLAKPCTREEIVLDGAPRLKLLCEQEIAVFLDGEKQYYMLSHSRTGAHVQEFENMIETFKAL